jgi:hypothetical protein
MIPSDEEYTVWNTYDNQQWWDKRHHDRQFESKQSDTSKRPNNGDKYDNVTLNNNPNRPEEHV